MELYSLLQQQVYLYILLTECLNFKIAFIEHYLTFLHVLECN